MIENLSNDGNTNRLKRHSCDSKQTEDGMIVSSVDKNSLKSAAVNFIAKDLRPYSAVQDEGLRDLCIASMRFGQKNIRAQPKDLVKALPTRNTVKDAISSKANAIQKSISVILRKAINSGGIAATTDTWTDDYRHISYICVVAHTALFENQEIVYRRFVLSTSEISEIVKTGNNQIITFIIIKFILKRHFFYLKVMIH